MIEGILTFGPLSFFCGAAIGIVITRMLWLADVREIDDHATMLEEALMERGRSDRAWDEAVAVYRDLREVSEAVGALETTEG